MILELSGVIVSISKHPGGSSRPGLQSPWEGPPTCQAQAPRGESASQKEFLGCLG